MLSAQSLTRCKYWFDQNYSAAQEVTLGNSTLQFQVDASALRVGLHSLNLHIQDSAGVWSSPRSFLFFYVPSVASATSIYKYWFDDNTADAQNGTLTNGTMMLNASSLPVGMHTLSLQCMVGTDIRVEQHLFYKMPAPAQSTSFTFHYRIDGGEFQTADFNSQGGAVALTLDLSDIAEGTHTIDHYVTNGANTPMTVMQTDTFERPHVTQYFTLTVLSANETMGYTLGSGVWPDDDPVSIEAVPHPNYHFTNWNDNVTTNPRNIVLTSDTTFTAYFAYNDGVEDYSSENILVYTRPGTIMVSVEIPKSIWVYDMQGRLVAHRPDDGSTTCAIPVSGGTYLVKLGDVSLKKVVVTE